MASFPSSVIHYLQRTVGAVEIGTFVFILLFGFSTAQTYIYFCNFALDRKALKVTVLAIWMCNLVLLVLLCIGLDVATILEYGEPSQLGKAPLPEVIAIIPALLADRLVQLVLTERIHKLTRSSLVLIVFTTLIFICLAGGVYSVYRFFKADLVSADFQNNNEVLLGSTLVLEAIIDICLTVAVCWWLRQGRPHTANRTTIWQIDTLFMWSIETGTLTSLITLGTAFCFFYVKNSYTWVVMWIAVPGVYSNSLLALLNGRIGLSGSTEYISCTLPYRTNPPRTVHSSGTVSTFVAGSDTMRSDGSRICSQCASCERSLDPIP